MEKYQELEKQYIPIIENLDKEISITKVHLADLEQKKSNIIKEYITKSVGS